MEFGQQFKVIQGSVEGSGSVARPKPMLRGIRIPDEVRQKYIDSKNADASPKSEHEKTLDLHRRGVLTHEEARVRLENDMSSPLHPKHGTVIQGNVEGPRELGS